MSIFAKKSLGQNFLMHLQTAQRIVAAANLPEGATVLEIGPGRGQLTRALLEKAEKVVAVEADGSLVAELQQTFADDINAGRLNLIHADVRSFDPSPLPAGYHLVANIPYYITGELLRSFLAHAHKPASMTFLVQKEVAERIARSKKESLLSIAVKAYGSPRYAFTVPRGAFVPAPNVDSAVLHISSISGSHFETLGEEQRFFDIVRAGFAHKRKQLAKNLEEFSPGEDIKKVLVEIGIAPNARAEDIALEDWLSLSKKLAN